ncbi:hypothetical protein M426DRAFT_321669 [Hypoxylon sp. CI-4A]|nr:hypothetical protein M426DRAFT_321669 [Hypoxylon sp. CI-4A]
MATLRSRKFLSCFYCGKRSKLRFEGQKSFDCANCDATNWLDERGDITDPPAATAPVERSYVQYAIPRGSAIRSPTRSLSPYGGNPEEAIFCDTCLRNQHMLTSSLAQFEWPDESNKVEYAAREKKYWALRKDLEKRYPQMCANCEPKVEKKLHEASYTAQTDHLRRMMDRTRSQRQEVKKRGVLDVFDTAGRWSWHLGFTLQFLWHAVMLWSILMEQVVLNGTDSRFATIAKGVLQFFDGRLPHPDRLMSWAIKLGICSLPWNPRFKQTIRGFTAHYLGFKHWYTYQFFILIVRFAGLSMAQYSSSRNLQISAQLGAQLAIGLMMLYVYRASPKAIRTDTSPLFRTRAKSGSTRKPAIVSEPPTNQNDLGGILDEIAQTPSKPYGDSAQYSPPDLGPHHMSTLTNGRVPTSSFGSMNLSNPVATRKPESQPVQFDEEMDWTPSASQHRAFNSYNPYKVKNMNPRFSDAPIEAKPGPIWYKVPPAPTTPAQRLRNPPMQPIIRESPKEAKENFFQSSARGPVDIGSSSQGKSSNIMFAEPKFFAPEDKNDPRDSLSNMFASSFSISPSPDEDAFRGSKRTGTNSLFKVNYSTADVQNHRIARSIELIVLIGALGAWVLALGAQEQYGSNLALTSITVCMIISMRLAADLQVEDQARGKKVSFFSLSWANLGYAQVVISIFLAWGIWSQHEIDIPYGPFGSAHFATAIIHHMWHIFI